MEDNKLEVELNGKKIIIEVLDIIEDEETDKKYMIYTPEDSEEFYISILEESNTAFTLKTIEDKEELSRVEKYLLSLTKENGDDNG